MRLLTFNTWGLKYISKHRESRLHAIADRLANPPTPDEDYDVVTLQEVWVEDDWNYLDMVCAQRYPFRRSYMSGMLSGPGLVILSKIPITETFLYRFPINGRASAFFRGDFFVGKSIAVSILEPNDSGPIAVLNSHMHAPYGPGEAAYTCHRACQAWDITKLVRVLKKAGYAVILVGDLNSRPGSLPYKLFSAEAGLEDSWLGYGTNYSSEELAKLSPQDQVVLGGVTCNSRTNTWRQHHDPSSACRLDFALIDPTRITAVTGGVRFTEKVHGLDCSYSDHFGYFVEVKVGKQVEKEDFGDCHNVYREFHEELVQTLRYTIPRQGQWRKVHFLLSLVVVVLFHVAVVFSSYQAPWSSVLMMLGCTVVGISGVVNGLIWGLGVRGEERALREVKMEVEDRMKPNATERSEVAFYKAQLSSSN